ncbi:hypothetical protein LTR53_002785 [Teratosphaeriaceae sp. CCFEE 6253]|nr:hypothetical protein LTR53_002785 [Teratosphaeriaceae sp. CCFEE 6253]
MRTALRKVLGRKAKGAASQPRTDIIKQYTHEPINYDTHIQLAVVPPSVDPHATLEVTLHTFAYEDLPEFAYIANSLAFSYEAISDIQLCNELYLTTRSLDVFLRVVRQPDKDMPPMFISALCLRPESIGSDLTVIQRMQRLASVSIDASAKLHSMEEAEISQLNARPLQFPEGNFAFSTALLRTRIAEHSRDKSSSATFFPYTPLDRLVGEIRLLRMTRNQQNKKLLPTYALVNAKLRDDMDFMAFSYTWGEASDQEEILINGVPVKVRRNLHDILMQMAENMRNIEPLKQVDCWFDALCINQGDLAEKNSEIRRMSQIYAASHCVHAWLGRGTAESEDVLMQFTARQTDDDDGDIEKGFMLVDRKRIEELPEFYVGIANLVMRPFFTRAWCTQELAMARTLRVMAGRGMAGWSALASLSPAHTDWQAYLPLIGGIDAQSHERLAFFQGTPFARLQLVERLQRRRKSGRSTTLLSLLLATLHLDSTIAKDKIYSLWSMASDAAELLPEPNYDQDDGQVFFDFTKAWIMKYTRLDVLAVRAVPREKWVEGHLPTWVTDYSSRRLTRPFLSSYPSALRDEELDDLEHSQLYSAAGQTGCCYGFWDSDEPYSRLMASGLSCDVLRFVGEVNVGQDRPFESWFEALGKECDSSEQPSELRRDFTDAMYANRDPAGKRTQDKPFSLNRVFDSGGEGDLGVSQLLWRHHIHQTISGRRLAITHKGHVGLVPSEAEVGDEVSVLFGCSVPLVFRQDPKGTRLIVGDCYFRRMMDGQMVEEAGGAEFCMTHSMPGLETPAEILRPAMKGEDRAAVAGAAGREVPGQEGIVFQEVGADEPAIRLPSGKALDRVPGSMKAHVPEHVREGTGRTLLDAVKVRPTPGKAVRIQPFVIA